MAAAFPGTRWVAAAWFVVWLPAYWHYWGWRNFLQLCDVAVFLSVAGFCLGSPLLLSSQAVNLLVVSAAWFADLLWRATTGGHLIGGTEYMWDARFPLWLRLLSLYHVALALVLLWSLRRTGYDARGWKLQAAIALPVLIASRLLAPGMNYNMAERDPFFGQQAGPAAVHLALTWLGLVAIVYFPTHLLLAKLYPSPPAANRKQQRENRR
ncbi:MAG: hypothetical protein ACRD5F_15025 [Candidatus Acidiferrales bacterium]